MERCQFSTLNVGIKFHQSYGLSTFLAIFKLPSGQGDLDFELLTGLILLHVIPEHVTIVPIGPFQIEIKAPLFLVFDVFVH